ncbi:beta strand repeat-containing protein, partial [Inquilinus sp. YAF38]|uniref:beta strand repeat-containing protein n=1 Tax=Inquilinus sp. YAF38 TaxID=3233084 RepID=UPI003F9232BA
MGGGGIMAERLSGTGFKPGASLVDAVARLSGAPSCRAQASAASPAAFRAAPPRQPVLHRRRLVAGLLGTAAWLAMPDPAAAQSCPQGIYYDCVFGTAGQGGGSFGGWGLPGYTVNAPTVSATSAAETPSGNSLPGFLALGQGGVGGVGGSNSDSAGGVTGGAGGGGGAVTGTVGIILAGATANAVTATTAGDSSPGAYAVSVGGQGGVGGYVNTGLGGDSSGGAGGGGGAAGDVVVGGDIGDSSVGLTAIISTGGTSSPGIVAQSEGGAGGSGGTGNGEKFKGGNGGNGGAAGAVTVTVGEGSAITTTGDGSVGILAQSLGGAAGLGGFGNNDSGGTGGTGGDASTATANNNGSISTQGQAAHGIVAQSLAGGGGSGGTSWGLFHSNGGTGAAGGTSDQASVENNGTITTIGPNAFGVLLQSIGGGGGAGGSASGVIANVGGSGGFAADGGNVSFTAGNGEPWTTSDDSITTSGISAIGVLGQSIGGGGGDGGGASGVFVTIGGTGTGGGNGGQVTAALDPGSQIGTSGDGSAAVVMQSIGGGGGNAGNAATGGLFAGVAIGGAAGQGGNGGPTQITSTGTTITTSGSKSPGLVAQSVGGGGGNGGQAFSGSIGPGFAADVSVGGTAGAGGAGGSAVVEVTGGSIATGQDQGLTGDSSDPSSCSSLPCNTLPVDSYGVVVQSIGGGGGLGGSAMSKAVAIAIPVTGSGSQVGVAASVALGGKGGSGGAGGTAQFSLSNGGTITTSGQGSTAVLVQSIGGGGGAGGDSSASAAVLGYGELSVPSGANSEGLSITVSMGGSAGGGGAGSSVGVALGGTATWDQTQNQGQGGFDLTPDQGLAPTAIVTYGDFATGLKAQSIGGGGGDAGFGSGNTQDFGTGASGAVKVTLGSTGGSGGAGGDVQAALFAGNGITTYGSEAVGMLVQSVGGGGGTSQGGSFSLAQTYTPSTDDGDPKAPTIKPSVTVNLGTTGGGGGAGGDVAVSVQAPITTYGGDATGVLAQSIGGGGGLGGSAGADASADNPILPDLKERQLVSQVANFFNGKPPSISAAFNLSIGGTGGTAGTGGTVSVDLSAPVTTAGDWAHGVVAQSIGGGGGKGGTAAATGTGVSDQVTVNVTHAIGGSGGSGNDGGIVTLTLDDGASITTGAPNAQGKIIGGFGAAAVVLQSIGGGGGIGMDGSDAATGLISVGSATGYESNGSGPWIVNGGGRGDGGTVSLLTNNTSQINIATSGFGADGVLLQSIGGSGGIGGAGSSNWTAYSTGRLDLMVGGGPDADGSGGTVNFNQSGSPSDPIAISTSGDDAYGILAQSIGNGGGVITATQSAPTMTTSVGYVSQSQGDGGDVNVTIGNQTSINTSGAAAFGIVAQSIGGGGGVIRVDSGQNDVPSLTTNPSSLGRITQWEPGQGNGGVVTVTVDQGGSINATGPGAIGIFAQSIGGGGGLVANGNTIYAGAPLTASHSSGGGVGGPVLVTVNDSVLASGQNGIGIFVQTAGYGPSTGRADVVINSYDNQFTTVSGGTGPGSAGIWIDTPANGPVAYVTNDWATITTADGTGGTAITVTGGGQVQVANNSGVIDGTDITGTITGSVLTNGGQFLQSGIYNAGPMVDAATVTNSGTFNLGMPGELRSTRVTGDLIQTKDGRLGVTVDSLNNAAGHLQVDGTATLDGKIVPTVLSLLPGALPVVTAGHLTSTADGLDALLFHWDTAQSGNTLTLAPRSDFKPGGVALNDSQSSLAGYYGRAWDNGDKAFATRFAQLS